MKQIKVKITYEDYLKIKENQFRFSAIKHFASKHLNCKAKDIADIAWNFKLTFDVWLR